MNTCNRQFSPHCREQFLQFLFLVRCREKQILHWPLRPRADEYNVEFFFYIVGYQPIRALINQSYYTFVVFFTVLAYSYSEIKQIYQSKGSFLKRKLIYRHCIKGKLLNYYLTCVLFIDANSNYCVKWRTCTLWCHLIASYMHLV